MLRIENIDVRYGKRQVLHGVSLDVEDGQFVAIVGANAAGKTTTINTISGLVKPFAGEIFYQGEKITPLRSHEIVVLGIVQVPEGRKLFPEMTVYENLYLGASVDRAKGDRKESLQRVFALFPILEERMNQRAKTLSGGEQQMLAIGRGMMTKPSLLMLDEPSLGLSPLLVQEVFRVISALKKEGLTILLVEQNVKQSLRLCDYAYVLENGRVAMSGLGRELLENEHTKKAYLGM